MRSFRLLVILLLQCALLVHAQNKGHPDDDPVEEPAPIQYDDPAGEIPTDIGAGSPKANIPGALAVGHNQYLEPADEETDVGEILEKLADLLEKLKDLVDVLTSTSTSTDDNGSPVATIVTKTMTPNHIPTAAYPCGDAYNYYDLCSSSFANFTTLPATSQAGCLCNVYSDADFNSNMQGCYSYVRNHTQYQSYATAIANGTSLCAATYMTLPTPLMTAAPTATPPTPVAAATTTRSSDAGSRINAYGAYCSLLTSTFGGALLIVLL